MPMVLVRYSSDYVNSLLESLSSEEQLTELQVLGEEDEIFRSPPPQVQPASDTGSQDSDSSTRRKFPGGVRYSATEPHHPKHWPAKFNPPWLKVGVHSEKPPRNKVDASNMHSQDYPCLQLGLDSDYHQLYLDQFLKMNGHMKARPVSI